MNALKQKLYLISKLFDDLDKFLLDTVPFLLQLPNLWGYGVGVVLLMGKMIV